MNGLSVGLGTIHYQATYEVACVWVVWNPIVGAALLRYGHRPAWEVDGFGEMLAGWLWIEAIATNLAKEERP